MSASAITCQRCLTFDPVDSPDKPLAVFGFGDLWAPSIVDLRENVERSKNTCDSKTQNPEREVASRAGPVVGMVDPAEKCVMRTPIPATCPENNCFRGLDGRVDLPVLAEESGRVVRVWIQIHGFIVTYCPDTIRVSIHLDETLVASAPNILRYRSAARYKHPTIFIILRQATSPPNRAGGSPPKGLLDDGHDVREIVDVRMVWQPFASQNTVELTLGRSHDACVPSHCEEKTIKYSVGLEEGENDRAWKRPGHVLCPTFLWETIGRRTGDREM